MIHRSMTHLTHIPTPSATGVLYRSALPFRWDSGELLAEAQTAGVSTVVMLVSDEEAQDRLGRDLRGEYAARALSTVHVPIVDYGIPEDAEQFAQAVLRCSELLLAGERVLVHCAAGIGRTGLFCACVLREIEGLEADAAAAAVRAVVPGAVETLRQELFVAAYEPRGSHPARR